MMGDVFKVIQCTDESRKVKIWIWKSKMIDTIYDTMYNIGGIQNVQMG